MIDGLIDKQDGFEIVRDKIAVILATEIANQQVLAGLAGKDPIDWKLRIFSERSNPWEQFLKSSQDHTPLVNVWYDSSNFDKTGSNVVKRQKTNGTYNIDCYAYGVSADVPAGGHTPGDLEAALEVHKTARLVRNILMSANYVYLDLRGLVGGRWCESITVFQPQIDNRSVENVIGCRIVLSASFNEFSPQVLEETLEFLSVVIKRTEDGEVIINADYDYT